MLENVLKFSIRNRWLVIVLAFSAGAVGLYSLNRLPIDAVPDITNKQVQINTVAPSLSPFEMEKQVTFNVEAALSGIPGLEQTRSITRNGFSQVTAVFSDDTDLYFLRQQVSERLLQARENLPPNVEPQMGPISTGLGEVYMWTVEFAKPGKQDKSNDGSLGWQSDGSFLNAEGELLRTDVEQSAYLRTIQDWIIRPQIRGLEGVAGIDSLGGYVKQYQVQPDPARLAASGLTFTTLVEALERNNVSTGAGYIEHKGEIWQVRAEGRITNTKEIEDIAIASHEGKPIYIHDVANVLVGKELRYGSATEDGNEVVMGTAFMLVGANSRTVAASVDKKIQEIRSSLPPGISIRTILNRTKLVDSTIHTVTKNLSEGALLVIFVLFTLLGNFRAALITALAIPLSMLLTSSAMLRFGISGNLMSLGAIDFGLIVDGAVIIIENCLRVLAERQHELGRVLNRRERLDAVYNASKQVRGATAFGEAIIITVYLPILALTGVEGKTFHPMALTVIFALVAAFVLSLTFIPAMAALCLSGRVREQENVIIRMAKKAYTPLLNLALRIRWGTVAIGVLMFAGSLFLYTKLGQEFVPVLDEGDITIETSRIPSTSLTSANLMQSLVEARLKEFPEVDTVFSRTGSSEIANDPMPPNSTDTYIILKARDRWPDPSEPKEKLVERLEKGLEGVPGAKYEFLQPLQMRFNELLAGVRSDVGIKVYGDDFDDMRSGANAIATELKKIQGAEDVRVEETEGAPTITVYADRPALARYGLNVQEIQNAVSIAIGGRSAGLVYEGDRRFAIVVRLPEEKRNDPLALEKLLIPLPSTDNPKVHAKTSYIPLSEVGRAELTEGPFEISRENGKRRVVVQCNIRGRDLGSFINEARARVSQKIKLPSGCWLGWGGQFEHLEAARQRLSIVVPVCLLLILLLLYSSFGSIKHALLVFTGVPLSLTGGIVALWIRNMPFSITAAVGFIALFGVAVLNGLVIVTFINQLRKDGQSLIDSIRNGSLTRLRPVLMTALVAALGFVPMALAVGPGSEVQRPLATVVIGGIFSSTLLTLFVLPALYFITHKENELLKNKEDEW